MFPIIITIVGLVAVVFLLLLTAYVILRIILVPIIKTKNVILFLIGCTFEILYQSYLMIKLVWKRVLKVSVAIVMFMYLLHMIDMIVGPRPPRVNQDIGMCYPNEAPL
jgi:hypothetical protein